LRISTAYELHWDRIALMEKRDQDSTRVVRLKPDRSELRYRGFSQFQDLPWTHPLTPDYRQVQANPAWRITPAGWCTRYGSVDELIAERDNALALLNGGDELELQFKASRLPPPLPASQRSFFLYSCGWDKDSDFHCREGWRVGPIPWHGLDDQAYGRQPRPAFENDEWLKKYNTRWVGPWVLRRPETSHSRTAGQLVAPSGSGIRPDLEQIRNGEPDLAAIATGSEALQPPTTLSDELERRQ
jgi:hypothetical protein